MTRPYSERELVLARREGFIRAIWGNAPSPRMPEWIERDAKATFPLPKRRVPKVVPDPGGSPTEFRSIDGKLEYRNTRDSEWYPYNISPARIRVWHDLLTEPDIFEDDDGSEP